jgi:CcmD family protein
MSRRQVADGGARNRLPSRLPNRLRSGVGAIVILVAALAAPAAALAQEFQRVDAPQGEQVPAVPFVGIAYGFIWIAVLTYVIFVARGLSRVRGELAELRRKLEGSAGGGAPPPGRP